MTLKFEISATKDALPPGIGDPRGAGPTPAPRTHPPRPPRSERHTDGFFPVCLNHAVLFVADLERSVGFYGDAFGMEIIARECVPTRRSRGSRADNHHDLGLFGVGSAGGQKRRGPTGSTTWLQFDTIDDLAVARVPP